MADAVEYVVEFDCPKTGADMDVDPAVAYGAVVYCSHCGGEHAMIKEIAQIYAFHPDGSMTFPNDEWARGEVPPKA